MITAYENDVLPVFAQSLSDEDDVDGEESLELEDNEEETDEDGEDSEEE